MDSCIISFNLNCIMELKLSYNIAIKVNSRKRVLLLWWSTWLYSEGLIRDMGYFDQTPRRKENVKGFSVLASTESSIFVLIPSLMTWIDNINVSLIAYTFANICIISLTIRTILDLISQWDNEAKFTHWLCFYVHLCPDASCICLCVVPRFRFQSICPLFW